MIDMLPSRHVDYAICRRGVGSPIQ